MSHEQPVSLTCGQCGLTKEGAEYYASWCDNCGELLEPVDGPFRDGKIWVLTSKCGTCIFRPGNKMHLQDGRVADMVRACVDENRVIPCHKTLDGPRSVCRGLYDLHRGDIFALRLAAAMNVLAFDEPPEEH